MNKLFKAAIIGGGASGLLAATELLYGDNAFNGADVVILERNDRVGKKLIVTGNGQGNISNARISAENYSGNGTLISAFIGQLETVNPVKYLENLGIITESDETGRIYPVSRQANAVLDILRAYLCNKNCTVVTGFKATTIAKKNHFEIQSANGETIKAENVILAVGGKAGKQFGTDGTSYSLATAFSHKLTPLYPSLVQLKTEKEPIKGLKGIKQNTTVSLFDGERFIKKATGDLLFTDFGVSGNAVFKISDKTQTLKNPVLKIDFTPQISVDSLKEIIKNRQKQGFIENQNILNGIVHKKLGERIAVKCGFNADKLATEVKNFALKIVGTLGFDYAQVTKGGIDAKDINPDTYESKLISGLYLTGEMLDIDGECGGYNLTFAFTSGIVAAKSVKNQYKK